MNKSNIEYINENAGYWYIRYKDPISKQWKSVSTKLKATRRNLKQAQGFRDELFAELNKFKGIEIRKGNVQYAFNQFKEVNTNKSEATKSTYEIFYNYLIQKISPDTQCSAIDKMMAEGFILWLSGLKHIKQNTKFGIQKNFQKFLRFLFEYEYIPRVFLLNKDVKIRPKVIEPLIFTETDRLRIINGLSTNPEVSNLYTLNKENKVYKKKRSTTQYVKNGNFRTMIMLLMYTGLRPSDIINVTTDQVDLLKMEMKFYSSKIDKWFIRPIHDSLKEVLADRIDEVQKGRMFEYENVKNMGHDFSRYLKAIGLTGKGYSLRTFRKDFISRSQEAGLDIATTALLVGHSNIKTTMSYYTKLSTRHLKDQLSKLK